MVRTREVPSKTIFARKQTRDKQVGGIKIEYMWQGMWNVIVTDWNIWYYIIKGLLHWYWGMLPLAVYHVVLASSCNMIYCSGQYSSILVQHVFTYNSVILFISHLLACKYRFTRNLSSVYQTLRRKNGMQWSVKMQYFLTHSKMLYFFGIQMYL